MTEWQPIETVPKDGRSVLLSCDYDRGGKTRVTFARWDNKYWLSGCWIEGWSYDPSEDLCHIMRVEWQPTHWMPLPEPPK